LTFKEVTDKISWLLFMAHGVVPSYRRTPTCNRQTDGQTQGHSIRRTC